MPLTDAQIRKLKPVAKSVRLTDGRGMYLEVTPAGGKLWRLKYRIDGKEKRLALGTYPEVSLSRAREKREEARSRLAEGIDPSEYRKSQRAAQKLLAANSFEAVAREWFVKFKPTVALSHSDKVIKRLEKDVFPWLGSRPVGDIKPPEILVCLNRISDRGALDTAHRAQQNIGQIFRYAVQTGKASLDPSRDLRNALPAAQREHYAAFTDPKEVAGLLRSIDAFKGTLVVQSALKLAPLFFVRPGELRQAKWKDIDFEKQEWCFLVTKTKTELIVPLASQAIQILQDLKALTGKGEYVFPGRDPKKPMSDAAVNAALKRLGYDTRSEMTGHGFRAMARTILHEQLNFPAEIIEHQLAHRVPDALGTAYNRTKFLPARREMMQRWASYLDELKANAPKAH